MIPRPLPEQLSDTSGTGRSPSARSPLLSVVDVILRDGGTLRLRSPVGEDADALLGFFAGLSERSLYLRFHGVPTVGPPLVEPFLDPDWSTRGALAASTMSERQRADARFVNGMAVNGDRASLIYAGKATPARSSTRGRPRFRATPGL